MPNRKGIKNAIIVQELIHTMSNNRGSKGTMAIKIDLEKVYDRLEWSFIQGILVLFKFPKHLISLIMRCVSSSSISVLFNGGGYKPVSALKGN